MQDEDDADGRGQSVPPPLWWIREVNAHLKTKKISQAKLAADLADKGITINMVQRCLSTKGRRVTTIIALEAISDHLGFPRPVVFARSHAEALAIHGARLIFEAREDITQASEIATGVGPSGVDPSKRSQTDRIHTENASSERKRRKP